MCFEFPDSKFLEADGHLTVGNLGSVVSKSLVNSFLLVGPGMLVIPSSFLLSCGTCVFWTLIFQFLPRCWKYFLPGIKQGHVDIDPARLFTFMNRKRTGLQVAASTPVSTPNGVDRIRRRADCVIMDVNSEMSASDRFFFNLVLSKPPVHFCQQNGYRRTEKKKANPWNCIFFAQENDILPFNCAVERILKGICEQLYILGSDRITGDRLHFEKWIRIDIKLPWPRCWYSQRGKGSFRGRRTGCMGPFPTYLWQVAWCHLILLYICSSFPHGLSTCRLYGRPPLTHMESSAQWSPKCSLCGCHAIIGFKDNQIGKKINSKTFTDKNKKGKNPLFM